MLRAPGRRKTEKIVGTPLRNDAKVQANKLGGSLVVTESHGGGEPVESTRIRGTVKWFNVVKGYGFVTPESGAGDVFLHMTVLRQAGYEKLPPGSTVWCEAVQGAKGLQVLAILEVDISTAPEEEEGMRRGGPAGMPPPRSEPTGAFETATVKWFNPHKGYGFVCPEATETDVFVHMVVLRRAGLAGLVTGQKVLVRTAEGPKGLQAVDIRLSNG